jgi:hypothetical protein
MNPNTELSDAEKNAKIHDLPRHDNREREMTPLDLKAIEARAEAAMPGPWMWKPYGEGSEMTYLADQDGRDVRWYSQNATNAFIAAARTDIPLLVAELRRLRAALQAEADAITPVMTAPTTSELRQRLILLAQ